MAIIICPATIAACFYSHPHITVCPKDYAMATTDAPAKSIG